MEGVWIVLGAVAVVLLAGGIHRMLHKSRRRDVHAYRLPVISAHPCKPVLQVVPLRPTLVDDMQRAPGEPLEKRPPRLRVTRTAVG